MAASSSPNDPKPRIWIVGERPAATAEFHARLTNLGYEVAGEAPSGEATLEKIAADLPDLVLIDLRTGEPTDGITTAAVARERFHIPVVFVADGVEPGVIERANAVEPYGFVLIPFADGQLDATVSLALYKHRTDRERAEKMLNGSVRALTEVLSMVEPAAFAFSQKLKDLVVILTQALKLTPAWEFELAALLCRVGFVTLPVTLLQKLNTGVTLQTLEAEMVTRAPEFGRELLGRLPPLVNVAQMVQYQAKDFDGGGFPRDSVAGLSIPLGARVLRILIDVVRYQSENQPRDAMIETMTHATGKYDPALLKQAIVAILLAPPKGAKPVSLAELRVGHVLKEAIETNDGTTLVTAGNSISAFLLDRLSHFDELSGIRQPIYVRG